MILAEFIEGVPAEAIKNFILIIAGLCAAGYYVKGIFFNGKQKREITFENEPAGKQEFKDHVAWNADEHDKLFRKIGGVERGARDLLDKKLEEMEKKADDSREKLHKRINRISVGVARLCGRLQVNMPTEEEET